MRNIFPKALAFILFLYSSSLLASIEQLKAMNEIIYKDPYPSYQTLLSLEKSHKLAGGEAYLWFLYRKAQAENLLYFFDQFNSTVTLAVSLITDDTPIEISTSIGIYAGIAEQRKGNYQKAISLLEQNLQKAYDANLHFLFVISKQELAYTKSLTQSFEVSLNDLQEAYVEAYAMEDHFLIAVINEVYGAIYGYMNNFEKSIEYYEKALETYEVLGYKWHIAEATYGLAATYRYWNKYDLAIEKFSRYLNLITYTPNPEINFFGMYGLGMTYAEKGDCSKAIQTIDTALALNGLVDYDAELYKRKAECLISTGELEKAKDALTAAESIFNTLPELKGTTWELEVIKINAYLEFALGNTNQAYEMIKDYYQKYSDVLISNSTEQLTRIKATLEMERQDVEISLLQQRSKVQMLEVEKQRQEVTQYYLIIIAAAIFILFILAIVIIQYRNNKRILALSATDSLSGVFNRGHIFEYLNNLLEKMKNKPGELAVLLFDIDDFKQINDTYGHPFGDEVICKVSQIALETLRSVDFIGRVGGEEFLCILPRTNKQQALEIAERLCKQVNDCTLKTEYKEKVSFSISIGVSYFNEQATTRNALYIQADKALYKAKKQGKNQVVVFQDDTMHTAEN